MHRSEVPEDGTASEPVVMEKEKDSKVEEQHGKRVVEETEDKDGVNPVGSATKKYEQEWRVALKLEGGERDSD